MLMNKKLIYITYQTFPAYTANSLQTISHISHFSTMNFDVSLIFPLRNKESNSDKEVIQNFYEFSDEFNCVGTIHPLPFKKIKVFENIMYILSHFLWSYFTVLKYKKNQEDAYFFTRSEWVFYFLSKKGLNVVYECHQLSKIKRRLIASCLEITNAKIIFLNPDMLEELALSENVRFKVIPSAYDETIFTNKKSSKNNQRIIYAGSLFRFGESRGLELFLDKLNNLIDLNLEVIIASSDNLPGSYFKSLQADYPNIKFEIHNKLSRKEIANLYNTCNIGLLVNNDSLHANKFTSPLKFFEYIASGLKIMATYNKAHNILPYQESFHYFDLDNTQSIEDAIRSSINSPQPKYEDIENYSMLNRINKIMSLFN